MSTVSGLFPNAITQSQSPPVDPAQQALVRRENDAAVFPPISETEAVSRNQNRASERPARQDSQKDSSSAATSSTREKASAESDDVRSTRQDRVADQESNDEERQQRPASDEQRQAERRAEEAKQQRDIELIREMAQRDREVRAHEQAHMAVGGQYAGPMSLVYETGPDGRRYAVAGEVAIDTSSVPNNPAATLAKAEQIRRAALAPADPSPQDRKVAAQAIQMKLQAQVELQREQRAERESEAVGRADNRETSEQSNDVRREREADNERAAESNRERFNELLDRTREVSERILVLDQYRKQGPTKGINLDFKV